MPSHEGITRTAIICFSHRKIILERLGYGSFQNYIDSPKYKRFRDYFLRKRPTCFGCGNIAEALHFSCYTYANLNCDNIDGIMPVCIECNRVINVNEHGERLSSYAATEKLLELRIVRQDMYPS